MRDEYSFSEIESYWRKRWESEKSFSARNDSDKEKFYCLEMFPYPSGKLHMGHVRNYAIGDAMARYHFMRGHNVLHPMGWDAFGLPAENAAIERNIHPREWTINNIKFMRNQLKQLSYAIDWDREFATCNPEYYKWCQWFFLKMYEKGLAYRKKSSVNYCDSCRTILANEQVVSGDCWRCGNPVQIDEVDGWFLKITQYADELLNEMEFLKDNWPERVLTMQRNWIGRSEGAYVDFQLETNGCIQIFTTRPDTLFGATFMVLAPENPLAAQLAIDEDVRKKITMLSEKMRATDRIERTSTNIPKEGIFTGAYAINPLTKNKIPVWVSDFVLMEYGTGAIMSVPAHDQRDFEFARKYGLPIQVVITPDGKRIDSDSLDMAFEAEGILVESGSFSGLSNTTAIQQITQYLEDQGIGKSAVTYRLRDWGISRQRYWGTPIPIIYCDRCGIVPVPEKDLPVELPLDISFDWNAGGNPLAKWKPFVEVVCPKCSAPARRETDTMDTFIDSSWYFARYASAHYDLAPVKKEDLDYWMPVDQYIGGIEHAVMHLLYARFFNKMMRDLGLTCSSEPFKRLLTQGMVCLEIQTCPNHGYLYPEEVIDEGQTKRCSKCNAQIIVGRSEKMSKSKKNTKDPQDYLDRYGADTIRVFSLFAAPPEKDLDWIDSGVDGIHRFLKRLWRFAYDHENILINAQQILQSNQMIKDPILLGLRQKTHEIIKRATQNFENRFHFNTTISGCMELFNLMFDLDSAQSNENNSELNFVLVEAFTALTQVLTPFAPHLSEEFWKIMGHENMISSGPWPEYDESIIASKDVEIPVQVNSKLRTRLTVKPEISSDELNAIVIHDPIVQKWCEGKTIRKIIIIPNQLINVVAN